MAEAQSRSQKKPFETLSLKDSSSWEGIVVEASDVKSEVYYKKLFDNQKWRKRESQHVILPQDIDRTKYPTSVHNEKIFERTFQEYDDDGDGTISRCDFIYFCQDALNQGKIRKVAIKFMANKDQFRREISFRKENEDVVKQGAVVEICDTHDASNDLPTIWKY